MKEAALVAGVGFGAGILAARCVFSAKNCDATSGASKRIERCQVFKDLAVEAGQCTGIKEIIDNILQKARKLVRCEASSLFLVDKEHGELYTLTLSGPEEAYEVRIPLDKGVAGHVAWIGQSMIVNDAYSCAYFNPEVDSKTGFKTRNMLCVPIYSNEKLDPPSAKRDVIGVVQLLNKIDETCLQFTEDDLVDLEELTLLASVFLWSSEVTKFKKWAEAESSQLIRSMTRLSSLRGGASLSFLKTKPSSPKQRSRLTSAEIEAFMKTVEENVIDDMRAVSKFDVLAYSDNPAKKDILIPLLVQMFTDLGFVDQFGFTPAKLTHLCVMMRGQYRNVPYHNFAHGFDVSHSVYGYLTKGGLAEKFEPTEKLALFLAAMFHDADHHGLNNQFHLRSNHPASILLETTASEMGSVLEIHHCNVAISILTDPSVELLDVLPDDQRTKVWRDMISCILATDMKEHGTFVKEAGQLKKPGSSNTLLMMQVLLKCADISNLAKPFEQSKKWGTLVQEEFYAQGDKERELGLEVNAAFDRNQGSNTAQNSLGFVAMVAKPYFELVCDIFPSISYVLQGVQENEKRWIAIAANEKP